LDEGENEDDRWIKVEGRSKTKTLLKPKLETTLHNAFAILSKPNDPNVYYMSESISLHDDDKTIMPNDRKEHRLKLETKGGPKATPQANAMTIKR
jgi:hypothetical protein